MIVPSEKLKQFASLYDNRRVLCERLEVDETILSRLLNGHRGASATMIEKVCNYTGWKMDDAFSIVEDALDEQA